MKERELKELERLARSAMEENPQESEDILEQALLERKDDLWQVIQKRARRRVRVRRARPFIAAAAMVVMAVIVSGAIGVNQARAGKDGLLVDIVEGVAGTDITFSEDPTEFLPIVLENVDYDILMDNIDKVLVPLLPDTLPEQYTFESANYIQPSQSQIDMYLVYTDEEQNKIRCRYQYATDGTKIENTDEVTLVNWSGTDVYIFQNERNIKAMWQQDNCVISISGAVSLEETQMFFYRIKKEP